MNVSVPIMIFGWVPLTLALFCFLRPRNAILVSLILGWLFLPVARYEIKGLPDLTKQSIIAYSLFLGVVLFDHKKITAFKFRIYDFPMLVFCIVPAFSSMTNLLGPYDAFSAALNQTTLWGVPYLIGRMYFNTLSEIKVLAVALIIGGIIYSPFILYEVRMSPQLHRMFYGYHVQSFVQTLRGGGYRPSVFMEHGLAVGMWMGAASIMAVVFWYTHQFRKKFWGLNVRWVMPLLLLTTILEKSTGSIMLLAIGVVALLASRIIENRLPLVILMCLPVLYVGTRATDVWSAEGLINWAKKISTDRAASLEYRIDNEDILSEKAREKPILGWGGWGRSRVYDKTGEDISITDGMWIIVFGQYGIVGVLALLAMMIQPLGIVLSRYYIYQWCEPNVFIAVTFGAIIGVYMIDNLFNGMYNPLFIVLIGSASGLALQPLEKFKKKYQRAVRYIAEGTQVTRII